MSDRPIEDLCAEPLPEAAREAIALFNAGEYYKQHDQLEALWRDEPRAIRDLYQGILQVGVGYFQALRGNDRGAMKMLMRSERWLDRLPEACQGVDIAALRADAGRVKAALAERIRAVNQGQQPPPFDPSLCQPVKFID